jgi:hypothetical protein
MKSGIYKKKERGVAYIKLWKNGMTLITYNIR